MKSPSLRPYRSLITPPLVAIAVLLQIALLWWMLLHQLERERQQITLAAHTNADNLAHVFQEHVLRAVTSLDHATRDLRHEWIETPSGFTAKLRELQSTYGEGFLLQIAVIGPNGHLRYSSLPNSTPALDLSDREHFRIHRETTDDLLYISRPVKGRVSGKWSIQFTRRINTANGRFAGVLVISVESSFFSEFYRSIDSGDIGSVGLVGLDGVLRARGGKNVDSEPTLGSTIPSDRPFLQQGAAIAGNFSAASPFDHINRYYTWRRVAHYPLVIVVGLADSDIYGAHQTFRRTLILWAAILSAMLLASGALLVRAMMAERRYSNALTSDQAELESANEALAKQQKRLGYVNNSLRLLNEIAALPQTRAADKFSAALDLGLRHLGLDVGIISHISGSRYEVEHCRVPAGTPLKNGDIFELGNTYCAITLKSDGVLAISHMGQSAHAGHPCYSAFQLESYIGAPILIQGQTWGTVNFSSAQPYPREFDEGDLQFMELLARWVASTLMEEQTREELRRLATTDALTGADNRRTFYTVANDELTRARRYGNAVSVIMIDIDNFKHINDRYGHHAGDEVLMQFAQTCRTVLREHDRFGRLGGEEFAVLAVEATEKAAFDVAERLRLAVVAQAVQAAQGGIRITVSMGVAQLAPDETLDQALERADMALYRAKSAGRNRALRASLLTDGMPRA